MNDAAPSGESDATKAPTRDGARSLTLRGTWRVLAAFGIAVVFLLGLDRYQSPIAPCGDQFKPAEPTLSSNWWTCPLEVNRHARVVGNVGGVQLNSVTFNADGQRGWAVGGDGTILATSNGGASWAAQTSNSNAWLTSVTFNADGQRGWVVGNVGTILATSNGGAAWAPRGTRYERWPPPVLAALTSLIVVIALLWAAFKIRRVQTTTLFDRILGRAVADSPVTRADKDTLGFRPVVQAVSTFLRHEATVPPVTVAVTAPWGKGKSSLMRLLQAHLQRNGLRTVWFNAWHHQKEPVLLATLLNAIVAQATPPWLSWQGWRFRTKLVLRRVARRPFAGALPLLLWVCAALVLPVSILAALVWPRSAPVAAIETATPAGAIAPNAVFAYWADLLHSGAKAMTGNAATEALFAGEWARFARATLGAIGSDPGNVLPVLATLWLVVSLFLLVTYFCRAFPARPGALLASLGPKFSLSQAEDQTGFRQRFREHFADVTQALRPATLTMFVDDLDRCEPAKAAEMLEAINYLSDAGECFVVMGISREIVEAQLGAAYSELADRSQAFDLARRVETAAQIAMAKIAASASSLWHPTATRPQKEDPNGGPAVQLKFARRYLGKLIQIEVPVPSFDAQRMGQVLRSDQELTPEIRALRWEENSARWSTWLGWFLRVASVSLVLALGAWQSWLWLQQDDARQKTQKAVQKAEVTAFEAASVVS